MRSFLGAARTLPACFLSQTSRRRGKYQLRLHDWKSGRRAGPWTLARANAVSEAQFRAGRRAAARSASPASSTRKWEPRDRAGCPRWPPLSTHRLPELAGNLSLRGRRRSCFPAPGLSRCMNATRLSFTSSIVRPTTTTSPRVIRSRVRVAGISSWPTAPGSSRSTDWVSSANGTCPGGLAWRGSFDRMRLNADGSRQPRLYPILYWPGQTTMVPEECRGSSMRSEREVGDRLAPLPPGRGHGTSASADGQTQAIAWHPYKGDAWSWPGTWRPDGNAAGYARAGNLG